MPHQAAHDQNPHTRIRRISYETYASPLKRMLLCCGIFDRPKHQPASIAEADRFQREDWPKGRLAGIAMLTEVATADIVRSNERRGHPKPANDSQPDFPI
jgi:hypothetical protein